jgi:hypothetical protein
LRRRRRYLGNCRTRNEERRNDRASAGHEANEW